MSNYTVELNRSIFYLILNIAIKLTFKVMHYRDYKIICNERFTKNHTKTPAIFKQFKLVMLF